MPRRAAAVRRETQPDAKFNNRLVTQLINKIMLDGKKSIAEGIVYGAFDIVEEKSGQDPLSVFKKAMDNVRPTLEVKPKRVGGATYQVPIEVKPERGQLPSRHHARHPLDRRLLAQAQGAHHEAAPRCRDHGRSREHRRFRQEA